MTSPELQPKSTEQIIEEFEALKRDGVEHGNLYDTVNADWLRAALASHLLWSAEEALPKNGSQDSRWEYHDNLTSLAHQIGK